MVNPSTSALPRYSVAELNGAIGSLLERGFAPRFLLDATVSRPQLKKGHLWLTLVDEQASIQAVVWASQLPKLSFTPEEGDGVVVVGKLNFWAARAALSVQVLDIRPSLSSVLRQFERVRSTLAAEGLLEPGRRRALPEAPLRIALLTSVPSSALADMLRTAAERWPMTSVLVVPIPVQGPVHEQICAILELLYRRADTFRLDALVLGRGGGSREDLSVFDNEQLARCLSRSPIPLISGIGHEDDTTVADLVADYRAATPTAAVVALLPDRHQALPQLGQLRRHLSQLVILRLRAELQQHHQRRSRLEQLHPIQLLEQRRRDLTHARRLLQALSPNHLLERGFCLVRYAEGELLRSVNQVQVDEPIVVQLSDGALDARVEEIRCLSP
jgi:exodeoxyribonuclease VII large subunit